jgi:hypothetical protein
MASESVNQLVFGARGRKSALLALGAEILQVPWHVRGLVVGIDRSGRLMDAGDVEASSGRGWACGALEVAQGFEGGGTGRCHFEKDGPSH